MHNPLKKPQLANVEQERILTDMASLDPLSEEYQKMLTTAKRLDELKPERPKPASRDAIIITAGNLALGIGVMLFETKHAWTSKIPLNFLGKK